MISDLEKEISNLDNLISKSKALERLFATHDFKVVIMQPLYQRRDAIVLDLCSEKAFKEEWYKRKLVSELESIAYFLKYLDSVTASGIQASQDKFDAENSIQQLRENDDE